MLSSHPWLLSSALLTLLASTNAFYLPGAAPHDYRKGEQVKLLVNALTPMLPGTDHAKLKSLINYDYYNPKFHFCTPEGGPHSEPESLGSILFGDRIFNSSYDIGMLERNTTCQTLCRQTVPPEDAKFINDRIKEDYALNWLIDGLPAAEMKLDVKTGDVFYDMGFNLGNDEEDFAETPALNNHYEIVLKYHQPSPDIYRVVGVLVWPTRYVFIGWIPQHHEMTSPQSWGPSRSRHRLRFHHRTSANPKRRCRKQCPLYLSCDLEQI